MPPLLPQWELFHPAADVDGGCHTRVCLPLWLGHRQWDVIVFNFGLHDISHDYERVGAADYRWNLWNITLTQASIVWASTTPVPADSVKLDPPRSYFDVIGYNQIASTVMIPLNISILDLYAAAPLGSQLVDNVHFTEQGYEKMAMTLAEYVMPLYDV